MALSDHKKAILHEKQKTMRQIGVFGGWGRWVANAKIIKFPTPSQLKDGTVKKLKILYTKTKYILRIASVLSICGSVY